MLISERFVMINFPKTGSTFCRKAVMEAHARRQARRTWRDRMFGHNIYLREKLMVTIADPTIHERSQHGAVCQVPLWCREHELISVIRNPFDRCRSLYDFKWWQNHPGLLPPGQLHRRYPNFPALSFPEFHELMMLEQACQTPDLNVGYQTVYFIKMYARDPQYVLARLDDDYVFGGRWRDDFPAITFLSNDRLSTELPANLQDRGFDADDVAFIKSAPRENVSERSGVWTQELAQQVSHDERYLLGMLSQLGFSYVLPQSPCGANRREDKCY